MGFKIAFIVIILALAGGGLGYIYVQNLQNEIEGQRRVIAAQELADAEQKNTIQKLQDNLELQTNALRAQTQRSQEIQNEMNRYLDIFRRHNLSKLAAARPGLIQPRVNNGTKEVFDALENDSAALDRLDD
jgi:predicted nucleotide-binding protein (sugar kinase/HSP70/actin superfamily)